MGTLAEAMARERLATVSVTIDGSPGPLEMNKPSYGSDSVLKS